MLWVGSPMREVSGSKSQTPASRLYIYIYMFMCLFICLYLLYIYIYTHMYIYMHTMCIYIYIYIYISRRPWGSLALRTGRLKRVEPKRSPLGDFMARAGSVSEVRSAQVRASGDGA